MSFMVHAYNSTRNEATGYSPYYLMFGREARLPVDVCFGLTVDGEDATTHHQYVEKLRQELRHAYHLASEASHNNHQKNKRSYDTRVRVHNLQEGDRVLVRALGVPGKHKLKEKWNQQPYVVMGKLPNLPVYRVRPEGGRGIMKTLHRDHLLPIGVLVRMPEDQEGTSPSPRPSTRASSAPTQRKAQGRGGPTAYDLEHHGSESEEDDSHYSSRGLTHGDRSSLLPLFPSWDPADNENRLQAVCVEGSSSPGTSPSEEWMLDPAPTAEEDADSVALPSEDPVADTGLEVGDVPTTSEPNDGVDSNCVPAARRVVKPVIRLSYDEPGEPTDQPLVIVHRGMRIYLTRDAGEQITESPTAYPSFTYSCPKCSEGGDWSAHQVPQKVRELSDRDIQTSKRGEGVTPG